MFKYKVIKLTQDDIPNYLKMGVVNSPCVLYGIHNKPFVWICEEEKCDLDYILKHNINYIKLNAPGSTIVCSEGDINFGFFGSKEFCDRMFDKIAKYVSKIITNSKFINNDFMYNGNKHGSMTFIDLGECYYIGVHISNNINKELISKICRKKCFKQPEKLPVEFTEKDVLNIYNGEHYEND